MPIYRRLPKRGFNNARFKTIYAPVNLTALNAFDEGATVDEAALRSRGLVSGTIDGVKLLARGDLNKKLTIKVHAASQSAVEKVKKAGGNLELLSDQ